MFNKALVLTIPARRSFSILARRKRLGAVRAISCRTRRWHGRTMQALDEATQKSVRAKGK
jgi:hypothetical protein